jgi:hypothetical protein
VIDIEVEPHADRVGRHQVVDVARLVERDLGVAGAWRQRAEHDGGTAALAPDQFRDGVDLLRGECHDRGAARLAGDLLFARIGELRQARAAQDVGARKQLFHHRADRCGTQHQGLLATAAIEHAIGEDVAALEIGAELDLVDRREGDVEIARHGLHGRDPEARIGGLDLLLAGDERDRVGTGAFRHLVVDFPGQEPQRQPDQTRGMREHALDGEVGLACIGGPQHRGDAVATGTRVALPGGTERDGHRSLRRRTDRPGASLKPGTRERVDANKHLQTRYLYHNATEAKGLGRRA